MNLTSQSKLTKSEWINIEKPVSPEELNILKVILEGYENTNIRYNEHLSFLQLLRIDTSSKEKIEDFDVYFYNEYFAQEIDALSVLYETIYSNKYASKKTRTSVASSSGSSSSSKKQGQGQQLNNFIEIWKRTAAPAKTKTLKIKKADLIRIQQISKFQKENLEKNNESSHQKPFEYILLKIVEKWIAGITTPDSFQNSIHLYSLIQLQKISISHINSYIRLFIECVIQFGTQNTTIKQVLHYAPSFIEKNPELLKYQDISLFSHQRELFQLFKKPEKTNDSIKVSNPKLVLYIAPTGTGKTLSPIGLAKQYRIIFVCVARHVGLALAKSAISVEKKVAFAFGCETASDIRLHYFAAINYTINKKSGGIGKVDNSYGNNVEIMICDVKSYLIAMLYMLAFNDESNIITYWDEPTITMDYETHPLHEIIQKNWQENQISKLVLSCATLPKQHEIRSTTTDFQLRFPNAEIYNIHSYDCKKSITLLNKENRPVLPHFIFSDWMTMSESIRHCENNKTLLRYFDLTELVRCIEYIAQFVSEKYQPETYFTSSISNITMDSVKNYYLFLLTRIPADKWTDIYEYFQSTWNSRFDASYCPNSELHKIKSFEATIVSNSNDANNNLHRIHSVCGVAGEKYTVPINPLSPHPATAANKKEQIKQALKGILLTTADAHTLTDGPTIYLVDDVDKIATFYIQQTKIPEFVSQDIMKRIKENETIQNRITQLEKTMEDLLGKDMEKDKKMEKMKDDDIHQKKEIRTLINELEILKNQIKLVSMDMKYIPNTKQHQTIWLPRLSTASSNGTKVNQEIKFVENAYIPYIEESIVKRIMMVNVSNQMKLLLLLGIGVFRDVANADDPDAEEVAEKKRHNFEYMEIMKQLATEQRLYMIIAQSDYIYGTNYQFCHAFIGKDLTEQMTPQKTIQAMGRVGRGKNQQDYTVRFRDNELIEKLLLPINPEKNFEASNMNRLFCSSS